MSREFTMTSGHIAGRLSLVNQRCLSVKLSTPVFDYAGTLNWPPLRQRPDDAACWQYYAGCRSGDPRPHVSARANRASVTGYGTAGLHRQKRNAHSDPPARRRFRRLPNGICHQRLAEALVQIVKWGRRLAASEINKQDSVNSPRLILQLGHRDEMATACLPPEYNLNFRHVKFSSYSSSHEAHFRIPVNKVYLMRRDEMQREWKEIVERLEAKIRRLDPRVEDELYADVLFACFQKAETYDWDDPRIDGRVLRIARNCLVQIQRGRGGTTSLLESHMPETSGWNTQEACTLAQPEDGLDEMLSRLPLSEKERHILRDYVALGWREEDVAQNLGMTAKSLRSRKCRLIKRLRSNPDITRKSLNS